MENNYVIGVDFGSDSVRSILVDAADGSVLATSVFAYPRWKKGEFCDPAKSRYRQHPQDHLEGLEQTILSVLSQSGVDPQKVRGIGIDATGSSPMPVDEAGLPLAFLPEFSEDPDAMMILWKDHSAIAEAEEITRLAKNWGGEDYTRFSGGVYSSEWFWAKILFVYKNNPVLAQSQPNWLEHCDYIAGELTGKLRSGEVKRSRCAAGHKALWHASWGGFPSVDFLEKLHPGLATLVRKMEQETLTSDQAAGTLSPKWAEKLGLGSQTFVAVGTIDAHAGAVGAGVKPGTLVKVMGTSTCDMLVANYDDVSPEPVQGISGQVDGSILPGFVGFEAGQAGFGDFLAWYKRLVTEPIFELIRSSAVVDGVLGEKLIEELSDKTLAYLNRQAENEPLESGVLAVDWINGRRSPGLNESLKSALTGLDMGTGNGAVFKALVESLCFGSKRIIAWFQENGVRIDEVVGIGGIAKKSPFLVQTMADILGVPIAVAASEQTPALGAAIYAAVASGIYPEMQAAADAIASPIEKVYQPRAEAVVYYQQKYQAYLTLGKQVEFGEMAEESR
ncbi:ribulokinase [Algoriphagus sp. H41]|uniref:Ribulokinase n=1 Tax=Algoriphagus oliviformis TaxID=2811231 RepID=A0ABS3C791_9BACT|nr:ribulokinase [Algoriphagus oliviformis]MBN7812441.1 ribulokinase [Algoriphagus oliviformis]